MFRLLNLSKHCIDKPVAWNSKVNVTLLSESPIGLDLVDPSAPRRC